MSRIGKLPIVIPNDVKIEIIEDFVTVSGKLGTLKEECNNEVYYIFNDEKSKIFIKPKNDTIKAKAMWGLSRSLVNNMVKGVTEGYQIKLEINGVGYKASVENNVLTLFVGFSHDIKVIIPEGIEIKCEKPTLLVISGYDKQKIGEVSATIRKLRAPEPYKGKGIKYEDEKIIRKVGKKK